MFIQLLISATLAYHISFYSPAACLPSQLIKQRFIKAAQRVSIPFRSQHHHSLEIYLHKANQSLKYEFDTYEADITYWMNLYFYLRLEQLSSRVEKVIEVHENLLIYYGDRSSVYAEVVNLAFANPLYYFTYSNSTHDASFHREFFIQNYSSQDDYIVIVRKQDRYDNVLKIDFLSDQPVQEQIQRFIDKYGQPFQQQHFTVRQLLYMRSRPKAKFFVYVALDLYWFKTQRESLQRISQNLRNRGYVFIITEPILLAKKLIQRFLALQIKKGPHLVEIEFRPEFKVRQYGSSDWAYYSLLRWILSDAPELQDYAQIVNRVAYLNLTQQEVSFRPANQIYHLSVAQHYQQFARSRNESLKIVVANLVPFCLKSFMLYAKLSSSAATNETIFYTINQHPVVAPNTAIRGIINGQGIIELYDDIYPYS